MFPHMNKWTPSSGYLLSGNEMLMCLEPSRQMHIINIVNYEASKERVIKLTSERSSTSLKCSSVVSIDPSTGPHFSLLNIVINKVYNVSCLHYIVMYLD